MSDREKINPGDTVEVTLRFKVLSVERHEHVYSDTGEGMSFTALTFVHGEPVMRNGKARGNVWTVEIPNEYGRVIQLEESPNV